MSNERYTQVLISALIAVVLFTTGFYVGKRDSNNISVQFLNASSTSYANMSSFWRAWEILDEKFSPAASTTAPKHTTYKIVEGDTLWYISMKEYETNYRWPDISDANKLPNPDLIYPDTILQLPR